jgi:hypothetical protein
LVAADPSAAGAADGSGRLPVELAIAGESYSGEVWEPLWGVTPEDLRLQWAATYLGGDVDPGDQEAVAQAMVTNTEWQRNAAALALFRVVLDGQKYELIAALPAAAKAIAAAETTTDVESLLAAAPAGAAGAELPEFGVAQVGVERKEGDVVVLWAGLAEKQGASGLLRARQPVVVTKVGDHSIKLERQADGADLGYYFGKVDLATAAPAGGRLLHLAALCGRPAAVVGALLTADASTAGVADGSGRLSPALAAFAGYSGEALALLHAAHGADLGDRFGKADLVIAAPAGG